MNDKLPLKSKKFIAYLIAEFGWKLIIILLLYLNRVKIQHYPFLLLMTVIIVSGFIQVGYILGQAALDKYIKTVETIKKDSK